MVAVSAYRKHLNAGRSLFVRSTFQKNKVVGGSDGTSAHNGLSFRQRTWKVYSKKVVMEDMALFPKCALQFVVQAKIFDDVKKLMRKSRAVRTVPAFFYVVAHISDYCYTAEDEEYELHRKGSLPSPCLLNVVFWQRNFTADDHLGNPFWVFLQATRKSNVLEKCYAAYYETGRAAFVLSSICKKAFC